MYRIESSVTFDTAEKTLDAVKGLKLDKSLKNQVRIVQVIKTQVDDKEPTYSEKEVTVEEIKADLLLADSSEEEVVEMSEPNEE